MNENILYVWFYRIIGAVLIITGLYLVLWGKNEERKFMLQKQPGMVQAETDHGAPRTTGHVKSSITQPLLPQSTENVWLVLVNLTFIFVTSVYYCWDFKSKLKKLLGIY